jgi:hypothetical protein
MGWQDILKIELRPKDVKRLGERYALMDLYESKLMTQEEYDRLPDIGDGKKISGNLPPTSKKSYHLRLSAFLKENKDSPMTMELEKYRKFHYAMYIRLRRGAEAPSPTLELFRVSGVGYSPGKRLTRKNRNPKGPSKYTPVSQIIVDYFTLYNRKFGRNPTLQEIANEEDRPLTVDEIESFKRYSQGR